MIALKYLLVIVGIGLFGTAGALVVYDVYLSSQLRRLLRRPSGEAEGGPGMATLLPSRPSGPARWQQALLLAVLAALPLLISKSIAVVPADRLSARAYKRGESGVAAVGTPGRAALASRYTPLSPCGRRERDGRLRGMENSQTQGAGECRCAVCLETAHERRE